MLLLSRNEEILKKYKKKYKNKINSFCSINYSDNHINNSNLSKSNNSSNSTNLKKSLINSKSAIKLFNKKPIMIRPNNIKFENINNKYKISKSHSQKLLSLNFRNMKKIPNLFQFHQNLMSKNYDSYYKRLTEDLNQINNMKLESIELNSFYNNESKKYFEDNEKKEEKKLPYLNLINYLKGRSNKFQFEKEYNKKNIDEDIKNIIKEELFKANKKIPKSKINIINKKKPLFLQKIEKDKCIQIQNPLLEINQIGNLPEMVDDGDLMFKLFKSGFEKCNDNKYKINY